MNQELLCPDSNPSLFGFLDPSIAPPLLFYSYIPTILLSVIVGIIVLRKSKDSLPGKLLFVLALSFSAWVLDIFILWIAAYNSHVMFGWQFNPLPEILIFISAVYFIHVFTDQNRRDVPSYLKVLFLAIFGVFAFLLPTDFNVINYDINSCEGVLGPLWDLMYYVLEPLAILWITALCAWRYFTYKKSGASDHARKIIYVGVGMVAFLAIFWVSNVLGEELAFQEISFFGALGMALFLGFLSYLIVKYQTFNIRVIGADLLVVAQIVVTGSLLFIDDLRAIHFVITITLAGLLIFGYSLVRGVRREVAQRQRIEALASELATANNDLSVANERLKELDAQKTEFVSVASHQLRAPTTAIRGYSSMLLEGSFGPVEEKARGAIDVIFQSSIKLNMVIEDFLNITRIELGKMKYEMVEADLKKIVEGAVKELKQVADSHKIKLTFSATKGNDYLATVDVGKITQVISNLIDNGIKYTPAGSIKITLDKVNGKNLITLKDTGIGMDKETLGKIFQKYSRAYNASKTNLGGTGQGLYIAKKLVEAHKGRVWAESEGAGKGSTFFVEL